MENKKKKTIAVVPARLGSQRVRAKNLRLLGGKPLIFYIINALKKSKLVDEIYINSDSELFKEIADRYKVNFYLRKKELATSESMIDDYIYDFCKNIDCDVLAVANPTSPFLTENDIDNAIKNFNENNFDTQLACEDIKTHCFYKGNPINFSTKGQHPRSQDLIPIKALNFAVTIWKKESFIENYEKNNYGVYTGNIGHYSFEGLANIDIDWEEDFILAEYLIGHMKHGKSSNIKYDPVMDDLNESGKKIEN